ncbi:YadA family autotransporter adhesin [Paraburkholderia sp. 2C]
MKNKRYVTRARDKYASVVGGERSARRWRLRPPAGKARLAALAVGVGAASFAHAARAAEAADTREADRVPLQVVQLLTQQSAPPLRASVLAAAPVTDYIAVSPNTTPGAPTHASDDLNAMAVGPTSAASGVNATAFGAGAFAARSYSTAVGSGAGALGLRTTAIGTGATTGFEADGAVAIGYLARGDSAGTLAMGAGSTASGAQSAALGSNAVTYADAALALGAGTLATGAGSVALGANSFANRQNAVSVGNADLQRQIIHVAAGTADTDVVNVEQLKGVAAALGGGAAVNVDGSVSPPAYGVGGTVYHNVGDALTNLDGRVKTNTIRIDDLSNVVNTMTGGTTTVIRYFRANSVLSDAAATGAEAIAIGGNARATAAGSIALGANSVADRENVVSVGSAGHERQIAHVAAGVADTDAVNVRQLKDAGLIDGNGQANSAVTYDNVDGHVDYGSVTLGLGFAGGTQIHHVANGVSDFDAVNLGQLNSAISQAIVNDLPRVPSPFVVVNGNAASEAAQASGTHAAALGANASANGEAALALGSQASATGDTASAIGAQAVAKGNGASAFGWNSAASADGAVALGAGSVADRANAVSVGSAGAERQIMNLAPGTHGTDAVNLDQLNAAFNQANQALNDLDRSTRKGIASASALQIVTPYLPGRTTLNAGVAAYRGQAALAIGVSRWSEKGTFNVNAGVASSGGNSTIVRAGVGIVIGD